MSTHGIDPLAKPPLWDAATALRQWTEQRSGVTLPAPAGDNPLAERPEWRLRMPDATARWPDVWGPALDAGNGSAVIDAGGGTTAGGAAEDDATRQKPTRGRYLDIVV